MQKLGLNSCRELASVLQLRRKTQRYSVCSPTIYADAGWNGWSDWLGNGGVRRTGWRPFEEARAFVQKLGLKSVVKDWRGYCRSGKKPTDIPSNPSTVYADAGWNGWGDWLGTGRRRGSGWRPFEEARIFAQKMELNSRNEWMEYGRAGKKPNDIPANPADVYAADWNGWGDWLGTGRRRGSGWRPFEEAHAFVGRLKFKSEDDWRVYCRSGKKPDDIPSRPDVVYIGGGWAGMSDWLGKAVR